MLSVSSVAPFDFFPSVGSVALNLFPDSAALDLHPPLFATPRP